MSNCNIYNSYKSEGAKSKIETILEKFEKFEEVEGNSGSVDVAVSFIPSRVSRLSTLLLRIYLY
jgi:hypothetical protein